jgi:hypothetical protein
MPIPPYDIFQLDGEGVRWIDSATTLEEAKTRIRALERGYGGEYFVLDQKTGSKHLIKLDASGEGV